mmetsp:Transcript_32001/g.76039  ORF Transcript_32001/g.76039 Transcript_32001/m.76039 type:complete len:329 (+) Transcript_32001:219-1205(+)
MHRLRLHRDGPAVLGPRAVQCQQDLLREPGLLHPPHGLLPPWVCAQAPEGLEHEGLLRLIGAALDRALLGGKLGGAIVGDDHRPVLLHGKEGHVLPPREHKVVQADGARLADNRGVLAGGAREAVVHAGDAAPGPDDGPAAAEQDALPVRDRASVRLRLRWALEAKRQERELRRVPAQVAEGAEPVEIFLCANVFLEEFIACLEVEACAHLLHGTKSLDFLGQSIQAWVVHEHSPIKQDDLGCITRAPYTIQRLCIQAEGLLKKDMFPGPGCLFNPINVQSRRQRDVHCIDLFRCCKLRVAQNWNRSGLNPTLRQKLLRLRFRTRSDS